MADEGRQGEGKSKRAFSLGVVRHAVQVLVLLAFIAPVVLAGWSLFGGTVGAETTVSTPAELPFFGTLSSSTLAGITLLDPFAMLETVAASKSFALGWLIGALPVIVLYGIVRGRAFCGWTCPVNLLLEVVDWLRAKLNIQVRETALPRHAKVYVALGVLVASALIGFPVFEALSPISFINKGIVLGSLTGGLTLAAIVLAELFWGHRVWCRAVCPLGGFYEVVGKVGLVNVRMDHEKCIGCDKCKRTCLCDPEILDDVVAGNDVMVRAGDCMLCGRCVEACPTGALAFGVGRPSVPARTAAGDEAAGEAQG